MLLELVQMSLYQYPGQHFQVSVSRLKIPAHIVSVFIVRLIKNSWVRGADLSSDDVGRMFRSP